MSRVKQRTIRLVSTMLALRNVRAMPEIHSVEATPAPMTAPARGRPSVAPSKLTYSAAAASTYTDAEKSRKTICHASDGSIPSCSSRRITTLRLICRLRLVFGSLMLRLASNVKNVQPARKVGKGLDDKQTRQPFKQRKHRAHVQQEAVVPRRDACKQLLCHARSTRKYIAQPHRIAYTLFCNPREHCTRFEPRLRAGRRLKPRYRLAEVHVLRHLSLIHI